MLNPALDYTRRGWSVIPIPYRSKNPNRKGWEQLRLKEEELARHFNGAPQNIGVLTGEPSGFLIDIDLDHPRAVELADQYLPPTPAVFGRAGKPRSHRMYRVTRPLATRKFNSKSAGMLLEIRSTGCQTVFPPSVHESGEPIEWEDETAEPAEVDPEVLLKAAQLLADQIRLELGEKQPPKTKRSCTTQTAGEEPPPSSPPWTPPPLSPDERAAYCLRAMLRIQMVDHRDGSSRLYTAACRVVEHDLDDALGVSTIRQYERQKPFPQAWRDEQILQRIRDAEKTCERGSARNSSQGQVPLGERDPGSGRLVLSPKKTLPTAEAFLRDFHTHPEGGTLYSQAGVLLGWNGCCYIEVEDEALKKGLQVWLHEALRIVYNKTVGHYELVPFESNPGTVKAALETIKSHVHLPALLTPPTWLDGSGKGPAEEFLPCKTTLLHLPTMTRHAPTPSLFVTNALDFDPDSKAPPPKAWFAFLHQLFDDDQEAWNLLQEWFGYCLTADTSQQKMLLIVGPKRSGKGTIARVLRQLVGDGNSCGPTTSSLAGPFGLQPLVGKTLATVSDARFGGDGIMTVVERLLCISGEDAVLIDRKFLPSITTKLPTRFLFLTNELPRLNDASGALAGRFLVLRLTESFYAKEDTQLTQKLFGELPGILNWAIEGWHRLHERGHFVNPQSAEDAIRDMADLSSPVGAFVREECLIGPSQRVDFGELYEAWKQWCEREGRTNIPSKQTFGRDLTAAVPGVRRRRGTGNFSFYDGIGLRRS